MADYPDICVSGAGTSAVNGEYMYTYMDSNYPIYLKVPAFLYIYIYISGGYYVIGDIRDGQDGMFSYKADQIADTPDKVTSWSIGVLGAAPAPTVKLCVEPEPEGGVAQHFLYYARMRGGF